VWTRENTPFASSGTCHPAAPAGACNITHRSTPALRFRSDALLLLAALIWGSAFVPQRLAAAHLGAFLFNGLRFLLGGLILLPSIYRVTGVGSFHPDGAPAQRVAATVESERYRRRRWLRVKRAATGTARSSFCRWASIAGILLVGASVCQQAGMEYTTAGNAGFLTGLYVVLVPFVMLLGWRQRVGWQSWAGAAIATAGVFLLGVDDHFRIHPGDGLELCGAVLWALHVVIVGRAVRQLDVFLFSVGQYFVAGALGLLIGLVLERQTLPGLSDCWWAVVYVGVLSVAGGYTLQALGQKHAPAADAAIILSMEAVFAALFGYLFLNELLSSRQLLGCVLILAAIAVVQFKTEGSPCA
jgi:drug/metabolite transporter (DMT)-like permease